MKLGHVEFTDEEVAIARRLAKSSKHGPVGVYAKMLIAALYGKKVTLGWEEIYNVLVMDDAPGTALHGAISYELNYAKRP